VLALLYGFGLVAAAPGSPRRGDSHKRVTYIEESSVSDTSRFPTDKVVRWLTILSCGGPLEYRAPTGRKTDSGNFDDFTELAAEMESRDSDKKIPGHYVTLNTTKPELLSRYHNRIEEWAKETTKDHDIAQRNWILVDIDPRRATGISSTDAEHKASKRKIIKITRWLKKGGFSDPIIADSGNGYHALYHIHLPNSEESTALVSAILVKLGEKFDDAEVEVDKTVFNAARITKFYGSMARKGDDTTDRPHRRSKIVSIPDELKVTPKKILDDFAGLTDAGGNNQSKTQRVLANAAKDRDFPTRSSTFNVEEFLAEHNIGYKPYKVNMLKLDNGCPWIEDSSHANAVIKLLEGMPTGKLGFKCLGGRCSDKHWFDFRNHFEPGYRDKRKPVDTAPKKLGRPKGSENKPPTAEQLEKQQQAAIANEESALKVVEAMNKEIAFFVKGSTARVLRFVEDEEHMQICQQLGTKCAEDWYAPHKWKDSEGKSHSVYSTWFFHEKRQTYTGLTFVPSAPGEQPAFNPQWFNMWAGWNVEPKQGDCSLLWEHILAHICSGNEAHFEWFKAWLANLVQHPESPAWTAVALRGPQGAGKGIVAQAVGYLCGHAFSHIKSAEALTSRFNKVLENRIFAFCDESFWAGNKNAESILKGLITEDSLSIEPKGVDRYDVKNRLHIIIASNETWTVPVGPLERRFVVFDVKPRPTRDDHDYFNAIQDQLKNGGYSALLYDLANYKIDWDSETVNPRKAINTEALTEQKLLSADPILGWWYSVIERGSILSHHDGWSPEPVPCEAIYEDYCTYVRKSGIGRPGNVNVFGKNFRKLVPGDLRKVKLRVSDFDEQGNETQRRINHYPIPMLPACSEFLKDTQRLVVEDIYEPDKKPSRLSWDRRTNREDDDDE